jgi:RimJ/RimL family protein N-acetyltransferase
MASAVEEIAEELKQILQKMPGITSAGKPEIENNLIKSITLSHQSLGSLTIKRLKSGNAPELFDFYFQGLSEESRRFWPPYPLFNPLPASVNELKQRIKDWEKETDWTVLGLIKDKTIAGVALLKRYKTEHPVSGLAVRDSFHKMGLGFLLQTIINEQARLLKLPKLFVTIAPDNPVSLMMHEKCGFKLTGRQMPHYGYKNGEKVIDREDIELVLIL